MHTDLAPVLWVQFGPGGCPVRISTERPTDPHAWIPLCDARKAEALLAKPAEAS